MRVLLIVGDAQNGKDWVAGKLQQIIEGSVIYKCSDYLANPPEDILVKALLELKNTHPKAREALREYGKTVKDTEPCRIVSAILRQARKHKSVSIITGVRTVKEYQYLNTHTLLHTIRVIRGPVAILPPIETEHRLIKEMFLYSNVHENLTPDILTYVRRLYPRECSKS